MTQMDGFDVVVVGAGIAGSALATMLARAGLSVLVLERSTEYVDRVRGEYMHPWGVSEAQQLGILDSLVKAGGNFLTQFVGYDEVVTPAQAEAAPNPLAELIPGVPGALAMRHPVACSALELAAVAAGARVVRGVGNVAVTAGPSPEVTYTADGAVGGARARLVVGADGRESAVRRQLGIAVEQNEPRVFMGGLLVEDLDWPATDATIGTEGDRIFFIFPQLEGRARLYLSVPVELRERLSGENKMAAFLASFRLAAVPNCDRLADATPAGPCAAYPMHDTWTTTPCVEGAALIGDAAGFSDPTIGEGLSIAFRDARLLGEALLGGNDWSPGALASYSDERSERMRRLRFCASVFTDVHIPLGPDRIGERRRRMELFGTDPDLFMVVAAMACGPELAPAECFDDRVRAKLLTPP